jgi:hypothetical protein
VPLLQYLAVTGRIEVAAIFHKAGIGALVDGIRIDDMMMGLPDRKFAGVTPR